jgi:hypothetical protein
MVMFTFRSVFYPKSRTTTTIKKYSDLDEEISPRESNVTAIEDDARIVADLAGFDEAKDDDELRSAQPVATLLFLSSGLMNSVALASLPSPTDDTIPPLAAELNDAPSESSPSRTACDTFCHEGLFPARVHQRMKGPQQSCILEHILQTWRMQRQPNRFRCQDQYGTIRAIFFDRKK